MIFKDGQTLEPTLVSGKFQDLVNTHFLQRVPAPPRGDDDNKTAAAVVPKLVLNEKDMYRIPHGIDWMGKCA